MIPYLSGDALRAPARPLIEPPGPLQTLHFVMPDAEVGAHDSSPVVSGTGSHGDTVRMTASAAPSWSITSAHTSPSSAPMSVTRIQDAWPDEPISRAYRFIFRESALLEKYRYDESYGTHTTLECEDDNPSMGETTSCEISFVTEAEAIPNSYWWVGQGVSLAAWPGQS